MKRKVNIKSARRRKDMKKITGGMTVRGPDLIVGTGIEIETEAEIETGIEIQTIKIGMGHIHHIGEDPLTEGEGGADILVDGMTETEGMIIEGGAGHGLGQGIDDAPDAVDTVEVGVGLDLHRTAVTAVTVHIPAPATPRVQDPPAEAHQKKGTRRVRVKKIKVLRKPRQKAKKKVNK